MKENFKFLIFIGLFLIFLYPFSIVLNNEDGASANYSFIILPLLFLVWYKKLNMPSSLWLNLILIFTLIFLIASVYQYDYYRFFFRRLTSFMIFMLVFTYLFIPYTDTLLKAFLYSIILISIYFSITTFFKFITLGGEDLGSSAKGAVGSQRYGFVFVFAVWILFLHNTKNLFKKIIKFISLFIITGGIFLTFSRSGIIALLVSFFFFSIVNFIKWLKSPNIKSLYIAVATSIVFSLIIIYINNRYPLFYNFFNSYLFSYFDTSSSISIDLDSDSSEGYRLFMLKQVAKFVITNPFTGSGFLGVWILFDDLSGSAHGQFVDVLFRTGLFGFLFYIFLIYIILKKLYKLEKSLFWGTISILVYGFFHETFKTSHGAFIFAFLLGYTSNYNKFSSINNV